MDDVDAQSQNNPEQQNGNLPAWCDVYEGLSDERIAEIEQSIVRMSGTRSFT